LSKVSPFPASIIEVVVIAHYAKRPFRTIPISPIDKHKGFAVVRMSQSAYDIARARKREKEIHVRRINRINHAHP
jgi:hypothetical protein